MLQMLRREPHKKILETRRHFLGGRGEDGKAESRHQKRVVTQKQRCASLWSLTQALLGIRQDVGRGGSDAVGTWTPVFRATIKPLREPHCMPTSCPTSSTTPVGHGL